MNKFRFDISFLRVIAVVAVVLFHFKVPLFKGGFIGVDVFFVISGFLMTKIILTDFTKEKFNILDFYTKRFRRIVPPLLIVCLGILLISNVFFIPTDIRYNAKNTMFSSLFISNIYYFLNTDYFAPSAQNNIFLHSWSLAVEWQFYIIYPIILLPFKKVYLKKEKVFKSFFVLLTVVLFLVCFFITRKYNSFGFYMTPTRAWEMLLGGIAFLYAKNVEKIKGKSFYSCLAYLVIALSVVLIDEGGQWPSVWTLIPTVAVFIIILLNVDFYFLKWKPFKFLGDISYELYLWHWPIYVTFAYFDLTGQYVIIYMLLISIVLASFLYYFINKLKALHSFWGSIPIYCVVILLSLYCYRFSHNRITNTISIYPKQIKRMNEKVYEYKQEGRLKHFNPCGCYINRGAGYEIYSKENCLTIDTDKNNIVLIGDSHSAQFSKSFRKKIDNQTNVLEVSAGLTFPFIEARGRKESVELIKEFYSFIDKNYNSIDKVFVSVHWLMQAEGFHYSDQEKKANILKMIAYFDEKNIPLYFIGQTLSYTKSFDKVLISMYFNPDKKINNYVDIKSYQMNSFLKSFIPKNKYIDVYNLKTIVKYDKVNSNPYMMDVDHFSEFGADQVVDFLVKQGYFNIPNK